MPKKSDNFENNLQELSEIVYKMENDELNIDEAIKLYKKGISLSSTLTKSLSKYEQDIFELKKEADNTFTLEKSDIE